MTFLLEKTSTRYASGQNDFDSRVGYVKARTVRHITTATLAIEGTDSEMAPVLGALRAKDLKRFVVEIIRDLPAAERVELLRQAVADRLKTAQ